MRCLIVIHLLAATAASDEVLLHEERVWKGVVTARTEGGGEVHEERLEFTLVTRPPRRTVVAARLPFEPRESKGTYSLTVHRKGKPEQAGDVFAKGRGEGRLHPRLGGWIQPDGKYAIELTVEPRQAVAKTTMAGIWEGRYRTWRTLTVRPCLLLRRSLQGKAEDGDVFRLKGEREFVQKGVVERRITVAWSVERIDPVLRGGVVDHHGRPIPGLRVVATTTNPGRIRNRLPPLRRETKTDARGRFALPAFHGIWTVRTVGVIHGRTVFSPARREVRLTQEASPSLELSVSAYELARLPRPRLLLRHFQRDVHAYLEYMKPRASAARMKAALTPPGK